MANAIDTADGKAQQMADIKMDTLEGDITTLGSAWEAFQLSLMDGAPAEGMRSFVKGLTDEVNKIRELFADGIDISDFGHIALDIFTKLKNKFLEFDGIGSLLAGGALMGALAKIAQKAKSLMGLFSKLKDLASFNHIPNTNPTGTPPTSQNKSQSGTSPTSSKVATMNVTANIVNLNSKTPPNNAPKNNTPGTPPAPGTPNNPKPSGSPTPTGNPPPPNGNPPSSGWKGKLGIGAASAALPLAIGAYDMYSTSQYNKQTAAEAQYGVDAAMSNLQSAQESGDAQAIAQAQQALAESAKYQKETLKYNRERELKSTGSMIGSTAGAVIGGLASGPMGAMVGGMLGEMAGNFLGGLVAQHTETSENTPANIDWKTDSGKMFSELSYADQVSKLQHMSTTEQTRFNAAHQEAEAKRKEQESQVVAAERHQQAKEADEKLKSSTSDDLRSLKGDTSTAQKSNDLPSAEAAARHRAKDKPLTEAQINDINKERGLRASEKAMMEGTQKVEDFFKSVGDFFSGKVKETENGATNLGKKTEYPQSIQEANQLGTDFWSNIKDSVVSAFTPQETESSDVQQDHLGFEMPEMKMPEFNFSQWWEEQTAGIEMPNLSELWSDFNASDLLPDIDISSWLNETFANIEMPDISSLLPDFSSLGETISESLSGIPTAASTAFSSISTSASETWSSVQTTWSQLPSFFDNLWAGAGSAASSAGSAIASGINSAIGTIQSAWEGLSSWLSSKISSLASMASSAASSIMGAIGGGGGKAMAEGGFLTAPQHILAGEAGPEVIIPLSVGRRNRAKDLLAKTLNILNGNADAAGFNSSEKLQTQSSQEETDELGNLKAYQGMADNLIKVGDLSPIIDAKLREQRKYVHNQRKQSEELQMQANQQAQEARVLSSIHSY